MHTDHPTRIWYLTIGPKCEESCLTAWKRLAQTVWKRWVQPESRVRTYTREEAVAKDTLGRPIAIGDTVAYAIRDGNSPDLKIGDVIGVKDGKICVEAENREGRLTKRTLSHLDRVAVLQSPTC